MNYKTLRMKNIFRSALFILWFGGLTAGCGEGKTDEPLFAASLAIGNSDGGEQSEFLPEEIIRFFSSIENFTSTGQVLGFSIEPIVEIFVRESEGIVDLWRSSDSVAFTIKPTTVIFNPHEEKIYPFDWDQFLLDGSALAPGIYFAQAAFYPNGSDPESGTETAILSEERRFTVLEAEVEVEVEEAGIK